MTAAVAANRADLALADCAAMRHALPGNAWAARAEATLWLDAGDAARAADLLRSVGTADLAKDAEATMTVPSGSNIIVPHPPAGFVVATGVHVPPAASTRLQFINSDTTNAATLVCRTRAVRLIQLGTGRDRDRMRERIRLLSMASPLKNGTGLKRIWETRQNLTGRNRPLPLEKLRASRSALSLGHQMSIQITSDLWRNAAKNRSPQQLNRGFVGELDFASEKNAIKFAGVGEVVFTTRLRQLLPVLTSLLKRQSLL